MYPNTVLLNRTCYSSHSKRVWAWFAFLFLLVIQALYLRVAIVDHDIVLGQDIARRMLEGGSYHKDFFENNPPLLFYFHSLSFLLAKTFKLNPIFTWYGVIFSLSIACFASSCRLIEAAFTKTDPQRKSLIIFLIIALAVVPFINFSQKSHLLMLLFLPYLFLFLVRQQERESLNWKPKALIGFFAALGICLKPPYYFFAPILLELYWLRHQKMGSALLRADLITGVLTCLIYLLIVVLFHQDYVLIVFPIALSAYAPLMTTSWSHLLLSQASLFFLLLLFLYFLIRQEDKYKGSARIFILANLGFLLSFCLQKKGWPYQEIPALICSVIAFGILYQAILEKYAADKNTKRLIGLFFAITLVCMLYQPIATRINNQLQCLNNSQCKLLSMTNELTRISDGSSYFVFSETLIGSYLTYYAHLHSNSRFASLWMSPYYLENGHIKESSFVDKIKKAILEDFEKDKPQLVLVSHNRSKNYLNVGEVYFEMMKKDPRFSKIWQKYHYQKTFTTMPNLEFSLYSLQLSIIN
jgi:hypothetical protein